MWSRYKVRKVHQIPKCGFTLGGIDLFTYKTRPQVSNETAMYWYWFSGAQDDA